MTDKRTKYIIHFKFVMTIFVFIVLVLAGLLGGYLSLWYLNNAIAFAIIFAILLLFLFLTTYFRSRLDSLINTSYLLRIRTNQGPPLPIKRIRNVESLERYLRAHEFTMFAREHSHIVYSRLKKDEIKRIFQGYILEVVVYIQPNVKDFYLAHVDECVQKLQDEAINKKQKVEKILVTQIKKVSDLTDEVKDQIKEIIFLRNQSSIISTINVGLHEASDQAVMLYSDTYSPSMYYKYHVDEIKQMI